MTIPSLDLAAGPAPAMPRERAMRLRALVIGVIGFLTLVDLFATQAILPSLAKLYGVAPAAIGLAANASTIGMAAACLGVAMVSRRLNRRQGIWISLALLAVPTSLLSAAPDLMTFAALRVAQGVFMAAAFALTMAYLAEHCSAEETASALAAYITGVVASNLVGRLMAATVADLFGVEANFLLFAALNLAGAALVFVNLDRMAPMAGPGEARSALASWGAHLRNPALQAGFGIGFLILFAFLGIFTYVNFVLAAEPIALAPTSERFHWLTAPRSDVLQPSPVHAGLTDDPARALDELFATYVTGAAAPRSG